MGDQDKEVKTCTFFAEYTMTKVLTKSFALAKSNAANHSARSETCSTNSTLSPQLAGTSSIPRELIAYNIDCQDPCQPLII